MITVKDFPNRQFASKEELHHELFTNQKRLISLKRAQVYKSIEKCAIGSLPFLDTKALDSEAVKSLSIKEGMVYAVTNTTNYLDSHDDVHLPGLWKRSIEMNQGKLYYVENHTVKTNDIIVWPEHIKSFTKMIPWSAVGKDYQGETQALIYAFLEKDIAHSGAAKVIGERRKVENSVRMIYKEIRLGLNSDNPLYEKNKEYYEEYKDQIVNQDRLEETGMFWGIHEAINFKESSMVLGGGSNDATANLYGTEEPAAKHFLDDETAAGTLSPESSFNLQDAIENVKINFK